jgi:hypothetical protein
MMAAALRLRERRDHRPGIGLAGRPAGVDGELACIPWRQGGEEQAQAGALGQHAVRNLNAVQPDDPLGGQAVVGIARQFSRPAALLRPAQSSRKPTTGPPVRAASAGANARNDGGRSPGAA